MAEPGALSGTETLQLPAGLEGGAFTALLRDDDHELAVGIAELVARSAAPSVRLIRVGNPLRSPLTLERIMIQVAGPEGEVFLGDDPGLTVHAIAERQREEARVVLLIEQAESLHPKVLRSLQAMAAYFTQDEQPELQVVFAGRTAFRALLNGEELTPLRQALFPAGDMPKPAVADRLPDADKLPDIEPEPNVVALFPTPPMPRLVSVGIKPRGDTRELDIPPLVVLPRPASVPARDLEAIWSDDLLQESEPMHTRVHAPASVSLDDPGPPDTPGPETVERSSRWSRFLVPLLLLLAVTAGSIGAYLGLRGLFYRDVPVRPVLETVTPTPYPSPMFPAGPVAPRPALPSQVPTGAVPPKPVQSSPALAVPIPASPALPNVIPPSSIPSAGDQAASLRRDFDAFLNRSGRNVAALSDAQRSVLFNEFLAWRSQNAISQGASPQSANPQNANPQSASPQSTSPPAEPTASPDPRSDPRIVIHVPVGSATAEAMSSRMLASLGSRPGTVQARRVQDSPNRPSIRYFHPTDEPVARQAAAWLADTGVTFTLQNFTSTQPRPTRGTIEVWLPGRL